MLKSLISVQFKIYTFIALVVLPFYLILTPLHSRANYNDYYSFSELEELRIKNGRLETYFVLEIPDDAGNIQIVKVMLDICLNDCSTNATNEPSRQLFELKGMLEHEFENYVRSNSGTLTETNNPKDAHFTFSVLATDQKYKSQNVGFSFAFLILQSIPCNNKDKDLLRYAGVESISRDTNELRSLFSRYIRTHLNENIRKFHSSLN